MATLNKIMVIGNLGGDPEMRYTPQGTPVTSFSVAVNRFYTDPNGERQKETQWFRVSAWRQLAEQCNQYLARGARRTWRVVSVAAPGRAPTARRATQMRS